MFNSRPEAYSYIYRFLNNIVANYESPESKIIFNNAILIIQQALLDHEQNHLVIVENLVRTELSNILNHEDRTSLETIFTKLRSSDFKQSRQDMWHNMFGRRLESEIAIMLLLNPTAKCMQVVGDVSEMIIKVIEANLDWITRNPSSEDVAVNILNRKIKAIINSFLNSLTSEEDIIALGSFNKKPSIDEVFEILRDNNYKNIVQILHIHYKFAQYAFRDLPELPTKSGRSSPVHERADATNTNFYETPLYTICPHRGRAGRLNHRIENLTNQLGLMLHYQDKIDIPQDIGPKWLPDCLGQLPVLNPDEQDYKIVRDCIENDVPYIAGYSGMCSLMMPLMMKLLDDSLLQQQQLYLCAVIAYIVGGGFHSIHEVLAPCANILNIIPGYLVAIPGDEKAPPPNYQLFFDMIIDVDPEFNSRLSDIFTNYNSFLNRIDFESLSHRTDRSETLSRRPILQLSTSLFALEAPEERERERERDSSVKKPDSP